MSFRDDGAAAARVGRVVPRPRARAPRALAQVEPGAIRAALPERAPDTAEPFAAVLRDLDEVLMPGLTHWQSPRYFAYFPTHRLGARDPRRAARRGAQPGRDPLAHLAGAPGARGGDARLARRPARAAGGPPRPSRGHRLERPRHRARGRARRGARTGGWSSARSTRTRPPRRRPGCSSSSSARCPATTRSRCGPTLVDLTDACAVVATIGTTSSTAIDPVPALADRCADEGVWLHVDAAYAGSAAVCPELRPLFAGWERGRLDRRQPAQVAPHADGLLGVLHAAARTTCGARSASSPSTCGSTRTSSA